METQSLLCDTRVSSPPSQHEPLGGGLVLALEECERLALVKALYVVKDNWWLDSVEEALLSRLEAPSLAL